MNTHALYFIIFVLALAVCIVSCLNLMGASGGHGSSVITFFLGAALAVMSMTGLNTDWYSPRVTHRATSTLVSELNLLRPPTARVTPSARLHTAFDEYNKSNPHGGLSAHEVGTDLFTMRVAGDTARTCLMYHPATTHWSWRLGACHKATR